MCQTGKNMIVRICLLEVGDKQKQNADVFDKLLAESLKISF